ncbi:hypothetical protein QR721_01390 [Aciduricibacillus chroicocephali]|uniref:ABC-2 type transporter transmembrane domain-containing protein n=1 Tax=Aciduricibacillus chroicocephali TaxID=3054939 RepID=A0ABY9KVL2_9BACI|nr:hypothetical protein QR721_01390 [Bacillaceae bacterium 44XB]
MQTFKRLIKIPAIRNAIIMAFFYQIMFIAIFMYGYGAVPKNIDKLEVAIVNQDGKAGQSMIDGIKGELPFKTVEESSLKEAKEKLNNRDVHLVISMPEGFMDSLKKQGKKSELDFYVNEANPPLVAQSMEQVATEMTTSVNKELGIKGTEGTLASLHMPADQAKQLAAELPNKLQPNIHRTATVPDGLNNQMAPFFLTMVSYIGAMIFSMVTGNVLLGVKQHFGKWKSFWSIHVMSVLVSLISPAIGVLVYYAITGGFDGGVFVKVWLTHSIEMFAAIEFMSIFALLFRSHAMYVNLPIMLVQTIASGAMMTTAMMPGMFKAFSYVSIMFYSVQADYSMMYGGGGVAEHLLKLALIALVSFGLVALIHQLLPNKQAAKPDASAANSQVV